MSARVLVFGDSVTYGAWDPQGGWADRLKRHLHVTSATSDPKTSGGQKFQLLNLGIGSDTSTKVLARVEPEITARYSASWPFVFVLAVGINDSRTTNGAAETEEPEFRHNIESVIKTFRQHGDKILIVGLTPVAQADLPFKDAVFHQAAIRQYNTALKDIARAERLPFIDLFETALQDPTYMQSLDDGLHPSESGHTFLSDAIKPALMKLLQP
jgi:lysophospholipase L1-like esterase